MLYYIIAALAGISGVMTALFIGTLSDNKKLKNDRNECSRLLSDSVSLLEEIHEKNDALIKGISKISDTSFEGLRLIASENCKLTRQKICSNTMVNINNVLSKIPDEFEKTDKEKESEEK